MTTEVGRVTPTSESIGRLVVALRTFGLYCIHGGGCRGAGRTFAWTCRCPAGRLWDALDLEWRRANESDREDYCCEEHFPSFAMELNEQVSHYCPACSWTPTDLPDAGLLHYGESEGA